ncbi:pyridoxamine 5'-phosphate oxidase family protein [Nocardioides caldifontis]|uniref:pyridoxamine 5'-phosphate oxidase family protein n=1 Tax=Nocardioides caldifontis TaxID=2588938 RepID=UPI0011DF1C20|nr:pyridoxamine 5'-phosphate oxidase family protein [Nocardioides caldifontis]
MRMQELDRSECLELLGSRTVGRVALSAADGLTILPVNHVVHDGTVVFRTLPYGVIAMTAPDAEVAFEVDDLDEETRSGWSVVATGTCRRVEDPGQVQAVRREGEPEPWAEGQRTLYLRIDDPTLTGRRLLP